MAARFCSRCGQPVPPGGSFCPSCGAAVAGIPGPTVPPGTPYPPFALGPTPYTPYAAYPGQNVGPGWNTPAIGPRDLPALYDVLLAAVLGLVGIILSIVALSGGPALAVTSVQTAGSVTMISVNLWALYWVALFGGVSAVFALGELWFFRRAFQTLAPQDPRFSTPATLTLLAFVGLLILVMAALGLVDVIYQAAQCSGPGNPITSRCIDVGAAAGLSVVIAIVGLVALVGFIGFLIGIWRLGTRYGEGTFKVGAILLIFPVLNLVGTILILLAVRAARGKVPAVPPSLQFG